jgi:hypothetical protein
VAGRKERVELSPSPDGVGLCQRVLLLRAQPCRRHLSPPRSNANRAAHLQPPSWTPCEPVTGARHLQDTKWFVPGGLEVASGFGSSPKGDLRALDPRSVAAMPGGRRRVVAESPSDAIVIIMCCCRVFFVKRKALYSNIRFLERVLKKVLSINCTYHWFNE